MYALIKQVGDDATVVAVSESKELLRKRLDREARRILKIYYYDSTDPWGQQILAELLSSLDTLKKTKKDEWGDGDTEDPLQFQIVRVPVIKRKRRPVTVRMAFGSETVHNIDNIETWEDLDRFLKEYKDTDLLPVRRFRTREEKKAYLLGVRDNYGYEKFCNIDEEYPSVARHIK